MTICLAGITVDMKILFTSLFLIAACLGMESAIAQTTAHDILSTAGGADRASGILLEWTLGEAAVASYQDGTSMYTEGFHQPMVPATLHLSTSSDSPAQHVVTAQKWNGTVAIYPNPTADYVTIDLPTPMQSITISAFQMGGNRVVRKTTTSGEPSVILDFSALPSGLYLIRIQDHRLQLLHTYAISKI